MAAGERRRGAPAQAAEVTVPQGQPRRSDTGRQVLFTVSAFGLAYLGVLFLAAPGLGVMLLWMFAFEHDAIALALLVNAVSLPFLIAFFCVWIAALKALLLWRATPGVYDLYSIYYLRHWLAYGLMRGSRALLLPVFTTLYLPPWMRLLGARIGAHAEMSTVWCFTPELLFAGDSSFFADGCFLGVRRSYGGRFH